MMHMSSRRLLKHNAHPCFNMINGQLRPQGIADMRLLEAFESIPRESFVPPSIRPFAFTDANLPLAQDCVPPRRLLAPLTLGKLIQLANIQSTDVVLIVGCGSGYSLALITRLAAYVIGLESHEGLANSAQNYEADHEVSNSQVVTGALSVGYPKKAPYDVILVEGAVGKIPPILLQQLSPHQGRLVTVIREDAKVGFGKVTLVTRKDGALTQMTPFDASCPYLPEFEPTEAFTL